MLKGRELWRLRINFLLLMILNFLVELGFDTILPTFHQYVTNPTAQEINATANNGTEVYPGLGQSEFFYSITITMFSCGAIITGPIVGYLTIYIPYFYVVLTSLILHIGANLLCGLATQAWMLALGRFLMGTSFRILYTLSLTYIGNKESSYDQAYKDNKIESGKLKDKEDQGSNIKKNAYILLSFSVIFPSIIGPGASSLIIQFASADLFMWIGYFNVICGGLAIVFLVVMFHGEYKMTNKKKMDGPKSSKPTRDSGKVEMNCKRISMLIFLLCTYAVWKVSAEVFYALFNPILSDSFGMTEKETSYYFIGLLASYVLGSFAVIILNNVINKYHHLPALIGVFVALIITSALIADWQTVQEDSCKLLSPFNNGGLYNVSKVCEELKLPEIKVDWYCVNSSNDNELRYLPNSFGKELCLATKECHWNQVSIISKSVCLSCPQICRGVQYSPNFIQYTIAVLIYMIVLPAGEVSTLILVSNNLKGHEQGPFLGVFTTVGGISGAISPIGIDYIYERSKKRTFLLMTVIIISLIIILIGLISFYKILEPPPGKDITESEDVDEDENDATINESTNLIGGNWEVL